MVPQKDIDALRNEKYGGNPDSDMRTDIQRLEQGEPLAYVIGTQPFSGLTIHLDSHPLIPRPETEWWSELLYTHIGERNVRVLDLCAGSGAIGLSVLANCKNTHVYFGEIDPTHALTIKKNILENNLDVSRAHIQTGDLFEPFMNQRFDFIVSNPPYIPERRVLDASIIDYEPHHALFAGENGMDIITRIASAVPTYIEPQGEVWVECDISNALETQALFTKSALRTTLLLDQYERPRLVVAYY